MQARSLLPVGRADLQVSTIKLQGDLSPHNKVQTHGQDSEALAKL